MTRASINDTLWIAGLLLQCSLLILLFTRRIARHLPVLTVLFTFYPLRSALLFVLSRYLDPATYAAIYNTTSLANIILQFAVALEIAIHLLRASPGRTLLRILLLVLLPAASGATLLVIRTLPANSPLPPDRLQIFASSVMVLLCFCTLIQTTANQTITLLRRLTLGFAFYGLLSILAICFHTVAAIHRDVRAFEQWSYILSVVYLLTVIYWIVTLKPILTCKSFA
jgi:hypothetical protein